MKKRLLLCVLCVLLSVSVFAAEPEYTSFSELSGKTAAMLTGAPFEELIRSHAPDVKEFRYFSAIPDMELALEGGKIDAFLMNNAVAELAVNRNENIALFPEPLGETTFGFAFRKGDPARADWQEAFERISGETKQALWEKWTGADESVKTLPPQDWPGAAGTVHAAVCDTLEPMSYRGDNGEIIGFDIEMILLMAEKLDVHVEFDGMEFASVMPSVESGKALLGAGSIVVNDERKEMVDFVEYYPASFVLIVRAAENAAAGGGFWDGVRDSLYRTFLKEARYKMVLSGLGVTLIVTAASGFLGTLLAFGLVFLRHRNRPFWNGVIAVYGSVIAGIPAAIILLVLYYVVFGKVQISAVFVAVLGFTLIYGARAYGVVWSSVSAVDSGQEEAALALGYRRDAAFREIILPQSARIYRPLLHAQLVALLKETSVAGFITVLELTRAGDLIRSRTMQAFFPYLSIALMYYLLTWALTRVLKLTDRHEERRRAARRIPGVD